MNKKILTISLVVLVLLLLGVLGVYMITETNKFDDYNQVSDEHYLYKENNNIYLYGDADEEETHVAQVAAGLEYFGGIQKQTFDDVGEGDLPNIVVKYNVSEWYVITTATGVHYAVIYEDTVFIE